MTPSQKIAKILRTDHDTIRLLEERLSAVTGKKNVIEKIAEENEEMMKNRLDVLGLRHDAFAKEIYNALIKKIEMDNKRLSEFLGNPLCHTTEGCEKILALARQFVPETKGFFLKKEKAKELLRSQPPQKIIRALGYKNVDELLQKEDLFEVFSALRFMEGSEWLNNVFFKQYENLKQEDFEERVLVLKALGPKWSAAAQSFIRRKYHNISHLKELGVIFIIPLPIDVVGETIRTLALVLHYLNEVPFYSDLFRQFAVNKTDFTKNILSLLRGDTIEEHLSLSAGEANKSRWLILQRYLAKDDENDWRLFEPHISPEALHWQKAERMLVRAGGTMNSFAVDLAFWQNLSWVGDYFKTDAGIDVLVSFNIVDTSMSFIQEKEMIKYLYHHQEALWNKIFIEYFGEEKIEEIIKENIVKGWVEI